MTHPVNTLKMMVVYSAFVFIASVIIASEGRAAPAYRDVALDFVTRHGVGRNLPNIAMAAATRTQTFATMVSTLGTDNARRVVRREIETLVPNFQKRWDENLAATYAKHFTLEELASLASEGKHSKYTSTLAARRAEVGASMRTTSEVIITELVTAAMKNAFSASMNGNSD